MVRIVGVFVWLMVKRYLIWVSLAIVACSVVVGAGIADPDFFVIGISAAAFMITLISLGDLGGNFVWLLSAPISRKALWLGNLALNVTRAGLFAITLALGIGLSEMASKIPGLEPAAVAEQAQVRAEAAQTETLKVAVFGISAIPYLVLAAFVVMGVLITVVIQNAGGAASLERITSRPEGALLFKWLPALVAVLCAFNMTVLPLSWPVVAFNFVLCCLAVALVCARTSAFQLRLPRVTRERFLRVYGVLAVVVVGIGLMYVRV